VKARVIRMGKFRDRDNEGEDNRFKLLHLILFRLPSLLTHVAVRSIILLPLPIPRHRTRLSSRPLTLALPPVLYHVLHLTTAPLTLFAQVRYPSHHLSSHPRWLLPTPYNNNNFPHMCIHLMGCRFWFPCLLCLNILVDMGIRVGRMDSNSNLDSI
jgi:hypothetical protein